MRVRQTAWNTQRYPSRDRKSTRLNSSHVRISYAVFCLKKKNATAKGNGNGDYHFQDIQGLHAWLRVEHHDASVAMVGGGGENAKDIGKMVPDKPTGISE